jgi:hypothetical protein
MRTTDYRDPERLADVMALIQVLAQAAASTIRSESGLTSELQGKPRSKATPNWIDLAERHREFFRVHKDGDYVRVALISRHVLAKDEHGKRPPLSPEVTAKLLELAISLHDRQVQRSQRFNYLWAIILTVVLTGVFSLLALSLQISHQSK